MKWGFFTKKKRLYPADRYPKNFIEEMLGDISRYEVSKIPTIFELLLTDSDELKNRTANVLYNYVKALNVLELTKLDKLFRNHSSLEWTFDWQHESPENLLTTEMKVEEQLIILGLCSFHPNGYFREKAIHLLAQHTSGKELSFLLIRCNDWVAEVREKATEYSENRLTISNVKYIVSNLPLIFMLKNTNRNNHPKIFELAVDILSQKESFPYLNEGTKSKLSKIRFFCYQIFIFSKVYNEEVLFNYLKLEKEPHLRLFLLNELICDINSAEFKLYYPILKDDKFPKVRAKILEKYYFFFPNESIEELENALLDKSGTIRSISRFLLNKQKITDYAYFYVQKLKSNQSVRGALLGIGEVGNKEHVEFIIPYLSNNSVSIVKAAIRAVTMIDGENQKQKLVGLLESNHKGISKTARKSLSTVHYQDIKEQLYYLYTQTNHNHTKYNTALLLSSLSKWDAIMYILEFYASDKESEISILGKNNLINWLENFNRTFVSPTNKQIDSINYALSKYSSNLEKSEKKELEFCLKGFS